MDFGSLPPEINSARIYCGPGSASLLTAAAAWDALAAELYAAASGYGSATSGLTGKWQGPAAVAMAQAAAPFTGWLSATATRAEQASAQAQAAAAAHAAAFAATVPPPVIAANRALLMSLVATNILGQNSPAIAATEADYEHMWAQDAAAMYSYASASASASTLTPFAAPPPITDPAGLARQGAAVAQASGAAAAIPAQDILLAGSQLLATVPQALHGLSASSTVTSLDTTLISLSTSLSKLSSLTVPLNFAMYPLNFLDKGLGFAKAATGPATAVAGGAMKALDSGARSVGSLLSGLGGGSGGAAVSAAMGRGMSAGALSVPHAWTAMLTSSSHSTLPGQSWVPAPFGSAEPGSTGVPFMPLTSMGGRGSSGPSASRFELRPSVVPQSPAGG
ncbi:PPE family protein [Mycobacterium gastri]|uniref:PPE family protein n=1 Tax=Mycobacterium gastri TaxID=1777 RepID=A0A1X1V2V4_MYCGS|nr:PPE family protein [Mycobacterium gastri]ETW26169.1 hypothetical protein MGAST_29045 [Mycobacterium gastri 'Wayne']ORV63268.1 hypothetical protein AWC07_16175 [Mycobacterium gastri]